MTVRVQCGDEGGARGLEGGDCGVEGGGRAPPDRHRRRGRGAEKRGGPAEDGKGGGPAGRGEEGHGAGADPIEPVAVKFKRVLARRVLGCLRRSPPVRKGLNLHDVLVEKENEFEQVSPFPFAEPCSFQAGIYFFKN